MAKVAEGMARVASDIAAGRRERSKLATEIKVTTRRRRGDVESFLKEARTARGQMSRKQAADGQHAVQARHAGIFDMLLGMQTARGAATSAQAAEGKRLRGELHTEIRSMLGGFKATRIRATRDYLKEAVATTKARRTEVKVMLEGFAREDVARSQQREENAEAQRERSAIFMKELTGSVDAFRDKLAKDGRDRAAEIRDNLASYGKDRSEGSAIWTGTVHKSRPVKEQPQAARAAPAEPASEHAERSGPVAPAMDQKATYTGPGHPDKAKTRQAARNQQGRHTGQAK
jgi:hypothetical protein